jgi:hypothetical protein
MRLARKPLLSLTTRGRGGLLVPLLLAGACSDAATRVAYDIEGSISRLPAADGSRIEIPHSPSRWPEGCAGSYALVIEAGASDALGAGNFRTREGSGPLHVDCYRSDGNPHAWSTTYHLRFVVVPQRVRVEKKSNEAAVIEIERRAGKAMVVGLH